MNNITLTLNDRLARASKKFTKACEQINVLKQELSVYIAMFSNFNELENEQEIINDNCQTHKQENQFNVHMSREMVRQKIETLQNFKNIFFMYAHQKADEITKIQCELYGEDVVRDAYDNSSIDNEQNYDNNNNYNSMTQENSLEDADDDNDDRWQQGQTYWSNNQQTNNNNSIFNSDTRQSSQLQLIEYDFLTA